MYKWQLHEAKNKLSHLIDVAMEGKPQCITKRGEEAVVVISMEEYKKMTKPKLGLNKFLLKGAKIDDFAVERVTGKVRKLDV
ncbi:MAG: type II toxin-antitoxin system Phd/YefM family antitoxin [Rickettsiaceae bacterium]|jgi:antitoxin Phd|nr:type II toxin-antitoxin system Phd/YefM family antitoxin [Rickettsiaceae bacterium]MCP5374957.1 type II toxin-antitoxin system Phd/YefM family antitoxin [Rickettsiaceae bacterium]MCP5377675.1 type II toxin-antitoxin system Phd/YefM family antitoxin [Rickettsiaceae bacterium]WPX99076.1 Type II toxin-antitoxin system Phd/YefM family [Candidatus Megaera polyxenophila]